MFRISLPLAALVLALPMAVSAQEAEDPGVEEGLDLLNRGTRLLLEQFMERMDPALDGLQRDLGEALGALRDRIDDLDAYHPPEVLPNGDIIIRRKQPLRPPLPDVGPGGDVEL